MNEKLTFRQLEGPRADAAQEAGDSPLELWYERVRDQSVDGFSDEDLCIASRQEVHLGVVIPEAIRRLQSNPLAGERYDGELLVALASLPARFWSDHKCATDCARSFLAGATIDSTDDDVISAVDSLRNNLN